MNPITMTESIGYASIGAGIGFEYGPSWLILYGLILILLATAASLSSD